MRRAAARVLFGCTLLLGTVQAHAFSPKCALKISQCATIQGKSVPLSDAEEMVQNCRDFTRRNIGARVLRMSVKEILDATAGRPMHPLSLAHFAYESLHDSPLEFDRKLPIEQRYGPVKRACAQVFRDMREPMPQDDE
jgi:hypothetical protein